MQEWAQLSPTGDLLPECQVLLRVVAQSLPFPREAHSTVALLGEDP